MNRLVFSIIVSMFSAVLTGVSLVYCLSDTPIHHHETMPLLRPIIFSALFYALVLNCIFYFMKRWGHFYLKRQGLIVTICTFVITIIPICFLYPYFTTDSRLLAGQYMLSLLGEFAIIGFTGTCLLKSRKDTP